MWSPKFKLVKGHVRNGNYLPFCADLQMQVPVYPEARVNLQRQMEEQSLFEREGPN